MRTCWTAQTTCRRRAGEILINQTITGLAETRLQYGVVSAQYGLFSGGITTMTTKSGTNGWHGEAYEYFRNSALNAVNHFALAGDAGRRSITTSTARQWAGR